MAKKEPSGFHTPFEKLKRLVEKKAATATAAKPQPAPAKPPRSAATAPPRPPPPAPPPQSPARTAAIARAATDDDRSFEQAMRGVTPLAAAERRRRAAPMESAPPAAPRRRAPSRDDDADAYAELADLVSGGGGRLAVDEDHPHSGRADGIDRRFVQRLRDGNYPIDARLDLHGHSREEAAAALDRFIAQSLAAGRRCLLVIHGRGLNSGDSGPVLRDAVQHTLSAGRAARAILAFALAPAKHGGDGATLVLLRKKRS
jgi:DNA-nicking Smr family endonuclease